MWAALVLLLQLTLLDSVHAHPVEEAWPPHSILTNNINEFQLPQPGLVSRVSLEDLNKVHSLQGAAGFSNLWTL